MRTLRLVFVWMALGCAAARAGEALPERERALAREIYAELIGIDTTYGSGETTGAAEAVAARLRGAGIAPGDVAVLGPTPRKGNLVARLRGSGREKPLLLLAHLDVVAARRED